MKNLLLFLVCFSCYFSFSQEGRWRDHFSYFHILDIVETDTQLICATENGLFTYDKTTNEIQKFSKTNGLNALKVAAIAYNTTHKYLIVAYKTGALNIIKEDGIEYFVDIPIDTDYQGDKSVKHIYTLGDKATLATDFGVVILDLPQLEFDETCYFRQGSSYIPVKEAILFQDKVYAATSNGVYTHAIDDFFPNFGTWNNQFSGNNFQHLEVFNDKLFAASDGLIRNSSDGTNWNFFQNFLGLIDINASQQAISFTTDANHITSYNSSLSVIASQSFTQELETGTYASTTTYGGSLEFGLVTQTQTHICPDGPHKNLCESVNLLDNKIYVAPGGREFSFIYPRNMANGYYYYDGTIWNHISEEENNNMCCIMDVVPNPYIPEECYVLSYSKGINKMLNHTFDNFYNYNTTGIARSVLGDGEQFVGGVFDSNGNFIVSQTFLQNNNFNAILFKTPTNEFKTRELAIENLALNAAIGKPILGKNNWIWVGGQRGDGLVAINYNNTPTLTSDDTTYVITNVEGNGNLPSKNVYCIGVDKNNVIWIGTDMGLRILQNPENALESENFNTDRIVITQNGIPEEFLKEIPITAIAVDEANRKWIGTKSLGVFYVSPNGQTTYAKFTAQNSPLPSNNIKDIDIDSKTGWVYIATEEGLVSYKSDITSAGDTFGEVIPYPNPVRPGYEGNIIIKGLANNADVKIVDTAGNLVSKGKAIGGIYEWNQLNLNGNKIASGIYIVLMINADKTETETTKIAIVR